VARGRDRPRPRLRLPAGLSARADAPVERLSNRSNGQSGEGGSQGPSLSADARFAVFSSDAIDLVRSTATSGATSSGRPPRYDLSVSRLAPGANGTSELRRLAFDQRRRLRRRVLIARLEPGPRRPQRSRGRLRPDCRDQVIRRVSVGIGAEANGASTYTDLSADGPFRGLQSAASNLIENDGNATVDIFVFDRARAARRRAPQVGAAGAESNG
jgi:hypothetical protein